ncbi:MAG: hypothetical protein ACI814_004748, partial [Mariniblastus sp.]
RIGSERGQNFNLSRLFAPTFQRRQIRASI